MTKPGTFFTIILLSLTAAFAASLVNAQTEDKLRPEPNYEITLNVLIGSSDTNLRSDLPANLSNISRQLKSNFAFSGYRLANTFIGRVGNNGTFEYKSTANLMGQESEADSVTFLDWSVGNLHGVPNGFQAQAFRFGARVPIKTGVFKDDGGKVASTINYESIGLNIAHIGVPENVPTLLGTLNLPRVNGMLFLVITVTTADR